FNSIIIFLGFSYVFLLDRGYYNNHFYFYCLLLFLFIFVDAGWCSLEKKIKKVSVPYWHVLIFKVQIFVVYFFGAIAKIDYDWLNGYPLRYWLWYSSENLPEWIQGYYRTYEAAIIFSYTGLLFDLLAGFALFSKRFKRVALIFVLFFHFQNIFYFDIGTFPFAMLGCTLMFANPKYGEKIVTAFNLGLYKVIWKFLTNNPIKESFKWFFTKSPEIEVQNSVTITKNSVAQQIIKVTLIVWLSFQFIIPLRLYAYKGNASWTGEGHLFAWRMMLVDTVNAVRYWVEDEETGERFPIAIDQYLTFRQFYKMSRTPKSFLLFAHFLRDEIVKETNRKPIIRMEILKSVNNRPPMLLNDTTLNYAEVEYSAIKKMNWITDWSFQMQPIVFDRNTRAKWAKAVERHKN
ncbi:MAG: HTTM domain-containing protein, partial [Vicingaceae bacterium]|nr:HTTM domain-containing protein [Vicingaceae bacterium]